MSHELEKLTELSTIVRRFGTPVWVYDAEIIADRIKELSKFDVIRFAQKACSNVHILQFMHAHGVAVDAVSLGEIKRALVAGYQGGKEPAEIVFTADVIDHETLRSVVDNKIPVNIGSIDMLSQLGKLSSGHDIWLRINPGFGHGHSHKTNTGGENSKHGIWFDQLELAMEQVKRYGLNLIGLHMHIGSGVDYHHLAQVCDAMVEQVIKLGEDITAISAGGGLSVPYQPGDERIDCQHYYGLWDQARKKIEAHLGHPISLEIEPGRFLVAEAGILVAEVRAIKQVKDRRFVLVDAGFNDLMRPTLYGSYHHITVLPHDNRNSSGEELIETVVAGPLCEAGDIFTQQDDGSVVTRLLPSVTVGDYLVFHNTGAYGAAMSSNYNSRPLLPEVLLIDGEVQLIRRRQTVEDLLALEVV